MNVKCLPFLQASHEFVIADNVALPFADNSIDKANRLFDMRCHRILFFDGASHYFWPGIDQLGIWTKAKGVAKLLE